MDSQTRYKLEKSITRFIAGLCVAAVGCFTFALLDTWTGVLRGTTLLVGQWWAMLLTFGSITVGAWGTSGVIVQAIEEERLPWSPAAAPRSAALASETQGFTVVNSLPKSPSATATGGASPRSERVRKIERMVQP